MDDFESELEENVNCKYSHEGTNYESKQSEGSGNELLHRSQWINKSGYKASEMREG
jgi:hypothetical protein